MSWLSDEALTHLRSVADWPQIPGSRYRILERIAQGGMGTVYAAEDTVLGRQVAIKIARDADFDAEAAERMRREARIIARLEHPGIVPVHDVGELADGRVFYVMKQVQGQRLDAHFPPEATFSDRLRVFERICETVAFAHASGVVHLDLKPQNIMVGPFGEVLILDWGIARTLGPAAPALQPASAPPGGVSPADRTATRAEAFVPAGTPAYSAPEQAAGDAARVGIRSDVFALGAILYALLTERPPLDDGLYELARRGEPGRIPASRALNAKVPVRLDAICMKALAWDPDERYPDALAFREDVARFRDALSVSAYREGPLELLVRFAVRYQIAILLVAAYLLMRILLIFWRSPA